MTQYRLAVTKKDLGRWFAGDMFRTNDIEFVDHQAQDLQRHYPDVSISFRPADEVPELAPPELRPWEGDTL